LNQIRKEIEQGEWLKKIRKSWTFMMRKEEPRSVRRHHHHSLRHTNKRAHNKSSPSPIRKHKRFWGG
jgi:hypothetical protein